MIVLQTIAYVSSLQNFVCWTTHDRICKHVVAPLGLKGPVTGKTYPKREKAVGSSVNEYVKEKKR